VERKRSTLKIKFLHKELSVLPSLCESNRKYERFWWGHLWTI